MFKAVANLRDEKGFTLIELLIVVAIIGILAAIAIPGYIGMQERSRKGAVQRAAAAAEQELAAWMNSARKAGTVQGALREVDTNNDGVISAADSTNTELASTGPVAVFVAARSLQMSPWGGTLWFKNSAGNGRINLNVTNDGSTISQVSMVVTDNNGAVLLTKIISSD